MPIENQDEELVTYIYLRETQTQILRAKSRIAAGNTCQGKPNENRNRASAHVPFNRPITSESKSPLRILIPIFTPVHNSPPRLIPPSPPCSRHCVQGTNVDLLAKNFHPCELSPRISPGSPSDQPKQAPLLRNQSGAALPWRFECRRSVLFVK